MVSIAGFQTISAKPHLGGTIRAKYSTIWGIPAGKLLWSQIDAIGAPSQEPDTRGQIDDVTQAPFLTLNQRSENHPLGLVERDQPYGIHLRLPPAPTAVGGSPSDKH